jgi:hypothetical protein
MVVVHRHRTKTFYCLMYRARRDKSSRSRVNASLKSEHADILRAAEPLMADFFALETIEMEI